MIRYLFFIFILLVISINTKAELNSAAFRTGKIIFSIGYGYPNFDKWAFETGSIFSNNSNFKSLGYDPIHGRLEFGLSDKIGIGISLNYNMYGGTWEGVIWNNSWGSGVTETQNVKKKIYSLSGLIRFNYHVFTTGKLDPYFSFGAGFRANWKKYNSNPSEFVKKNELHSGDYGISELPAAFETVAGMRYYISPKFAIYMEMGISKSFIQGGLSIGF